MKEAGNNVLSTRIKLIYWLPKRVAGPPSKKTWVLQLCLLALELAIWLGFVNCLIDLRPKVHQKPPNSQKITCPNQKRRRSKHGCT